MAGSRVLSRHVALLACLVLGTDFARAQVLPHLARYVLGQGPVKALRLPDGWACSPASGASPDASILCRKSPNPKTSMVTITARHAAAGEVHVAFHTIPNSITIDSLVPDLLSDEIRAVSHVLGARSDNQYVNVVPYPNPKAPAFHVSKMQFIAVVGRIMIKTEGTFMDADGHARTFDQSVVSEASDDAQTIDEIALTSPEPADPEAQRALFQAMIQTIIWRQQP